MRDELKAKARNRLARIEGQVRGIAKMVDDDAYCVDVLTQLNSVSSALDGLRVLLLDDHVRSCVADAIRTGSGEREMDELATVFKRFVRA